VDFQGNTPIYGDDNTVRLWDVQTGELRFTLNHKAPIWSLSFSSDGGLLASGDYAGNISIWNVETGMAEMTIADAHNAANGGVLSLKFSADGTMLISAGDERIRFWGVSEN
jgi:WD40 repeat protein